MTTDRGEGRVMGQRDSRPSFSKSRKTVPEAISGVVKWVRTGGSLRFHGLPAISESHGRPSRASLRRTSGEWGAGHSNH
jgi:hypothetical protein